MNKALLVRTPNSLHDELVQLLVKNGCYLVDSHAIFDSEHPARFVLPMAQRLR